MFQLCQSLSAVCSASLTGLSILWKYFYVRDPLAQMKFSGHTIPWLENGIVWVATICGHRSPGSRSTCLEKMTALQGRLCGITIHLSFFPCLSAASKSLGISQANVGYPMLQDTEFCWLLTLDMLRSCIN